MAALVKIVQPIYMHLHGKLKAGRAHIPALQVCSFE